MNARRSALVLTGFVVLVIIGAATVGLALAYPTEYAALYGAVGGAAVTLGFLGAPDAAVRLRTARFRARFDAHNELGDGRCKCGEPMSNVDAWNAHRLRRGAMHP